MEGETSKLQYKLVEYENTLYQIPLRNINQEYVLLLSDVQSILPHATGFISSTKLVPFQLDDQFNELVPKRVLISNDGDDIWTVVLPTRQESACLTQSTIELQIKVDQLSEKLDLILSTMAQLQESGGIHLPTTTTMTIATAAVSTLADTESVEEVDSSLIINTEQARQLQNLTEQTHAESRQQQKEEDSDQDDEEDETEDDEEMEARTRDIRSNSPPPAFSSNHITGSSSTAAAAASSSSSSSRRQPQEYQQHEQAPPSYETSVLSTIKSINSKLRLYESHISNRHKSPKWLRQEWVSRVPNSIEEVAYQLVQLEMALLWAAVSESWIQERETWLTLVASARSERHLAGAIINLERHTLVMDEDWANIRERWINELLEMVVLPLSHG